MFAYCTSLTSAPALPATALADGCYSYMFYGCAGLATQDINLPATTLAGDCYNGMFDNCGTASTKTVHIPTSLASEVTANTFGSNTGVIVMYDLK